MNKFCLKQFYLKIKKKLFLTPSFLVKIIGVLYILNYFSQFNGNI